MSLDCLIKKFDNPCIHYFQNNFSIFREMRNIKYKVNLYVMGYRLFNQCGCKILNIIILYKSTSSRF